MTREEAITIAKTILLNEIDIPQEDDIICIASDQTDEGWVLECNSRIYVETDDLRYALVVAPLLIHFDGSHQFVF